MVVDPIDKDVCAAGSSFILIGIRIHNNLVEYFNTRSMLDLVATEIPGQVCKETM